MHVQFYQPQSGKLYMLATVTMGKRGFVLSKQKVAHHCTSNWFQVVISPSAGHPANTDQIRRTFFRRHWSSSVERTARQRERGNICELV